MIKIVLGLLLGFAIGAGCRWIDIPVPSPPSLVGALLVVAMTIGYLATDKLVEARFAGKGAATTKELCGGPTGAPKSASPSQSVP